MYLKTFLFLHEFWILWEFRILGYFYFYLKPFNYIFLLFSSLHNFRCKAYCHSLLVSLCPVSPPPPWKQLSFLLNYSTVVVCGFAQSSLLPPLVPSSTLLWLRSGRRLLQSLRGCCTSTSPATASWFTAGTCSAGLGLMSLCVVTAVDFTSSQGAVKFYCLVHLGQFPRFPVKLGLVRCSPSRFVLFFLCNVVLAWRISSSFSWTNVFWKSWNL